MSTSTWDHWREAALSGTYTPLSDERLAEMFTATCRFGSGNSWTGTNGTLAAYVRELLREREWLIYERPTPSQPAVINSP
jgi:hypothetical protein